MKLSPIVKFKISEKRDFDTVCAFAKDSKYDDGRSLQWATYDKYPELKELLEDGIIKNKKALRQFIHKEYMAKREGMLLALAVNKKHWEKIAQQYYSLVDGLFNHRPWPKGKYIAYGTIWGMYPRFLEDKIFLIPFKHRAPKYIPVVVAHELLHFMFYYYFYSHYPKYRKPTNNYFVWHVSEIFNSIVQNSPTWLQLFHQKSISYPEHAKVVSRLRRKYYRRSVWDIAELTDEIIEEVKKNKSLYS